MAQTAEGAPVALPSQLDRQISPSSETLLLSFWKKPKQQTRKAGATFSTGTRDAALLQPVFWGKQLPKKFMTF
jgi:hypothetical protein